MLRTTTRRIILKKTAQNMETSVIITLIAAVVAAALAFILGLRTGKKNGDEKCYTLAKLSEEQKGRITALEYEAKRLNDCLRETTAQRDVNAAMAENTKVQLEQLKADHRKQAEDMAAAYEKQLQQIKETAEKQIETLKDMNKKQVDSQLALIREQMTATSETVLKARQKELGEQNMEQVSKIIDPLQQSLKLMREALDSSKQQQKDALTKLDATIQANMRNNANLEETAARLTKALTGDVKAQGNFGEMKLKQLLEDLGLKDGEQYDSQQHLRDTLGTLVKDDEGKGLIPDFILHFPNNRHVVVDSKMSFTAYERYMNAETEEERHMHLKDHLASVRAQAERLARKDYSRYLPAGYNKLNFVIMYIHTEGALNLALLNDSSLWREAYDKGVLILGPQTMYMNLRVLEMMWTQVRQLSNQENMMKAANTLVERVQDFGIRFADVETKMQDTMKAMGKLRITTADSGPGIITAARNLLKAGARENKKKKTLAELETATFIDNDSSQLFIEENTGNGI